MGWRLFSGFREAVSYKLYRTISPNYSSLYTSRNPVVLSSRLHVAAFFFFLVFFPDGSHPPPPPPPPLLDFFSLSSMRGYCPLEPRAIFFGDCPELSCAGADDGLVAASSALFFSLSHQRCQWVGFLLSSFSSLSAGQLDGSFVLLPLFHLHIRRPAVFPPFRAIAPFFLLRSRLLSPPFSRHLIVEERLPPSMLFPPVVLLDALVWDAFPLPRISPP